MDSAGRMSPRVRTPKAESALEKPESAYRIFVVAILITKTTRLKYRLIM